MAGDVEPQYGGALDVDLLAAAFRADANDTDSFFRVLVSKLVDALGQRVKIERSGSVLKRDRPVTGIEVDLSSPEGGVILVARRERNGIACSVARPVRGIVLSNKPVGVAEWVEVLAGALAQEANRSEQTWNALHGLLS
jgi:hypothetical protein